MLFVCMTSIRGRGLSAFASALEYCESSSDLKHGAVPNMVSALALEYYAHKEASEFSNLETYLMILDTLLSNMKRVQIQDRSKDSSLSRDDDKLNEVMNRMAKLLDASGEKALTRCRKCGSTQVITRERQTRGADEPATQFHSCQDCGSLWIIR